MRKKAEKFDTSLSTLKAPLWSNIDGEAAGDGSGFSVSLNVDGSIVAIGAILNDSKGRQTGQVRIYHNQNGIWTQIGQDIDGEAEGDRSGYSVSLSANGSIVAIGAPGSWPRYGNKAGQVRIYQNQSGIWTQIGQDIDGEAEGDRSGYSVSLSSDGLIVAIGALSNGANGGHVRVFQYQKNIWTQIGQDIDGEAAGDNSGRSVSLSSDGLIVAIGASGNDGNGRGAGQVRVYKYKNEIWNQIGQDIDGESGGDGSGNSVCLNGDGTIVAIGAFFNQRSTGHVRVYQYKNEIWTQIGQDIDGDSAFNFSGGSVSLSADGSRVAIGACRNSDTAIGAGQARIYQNQAGTWTKVAQDFNGEESMDGFGYSVSLSINGLTLAVGAIEKDGNGGNAGQVRIYSQTSLLNTSWTFTAVKKDFLQFTVTFLAENKAKIVFIRGQVRQGTWSQGSHNTKFRLHFTDETTGQSWEPVGSHHGNHGNGVVLFGYVSNSSFNMDKNIH
jgi:hypothetical protein